MNSLAENSMQTENSSRTQSSTSTSRTRTTDLKTVKMGFYNFLVDDDQFVHVFIAGHCENIGEWNGVSGFGIYFGKKHPLYV